MGASYGGAKAIQVLAVGLPKGYRLVVLERNSHANRMPTYTSSTMLAVNDMHLLVDLYVLPRYAVVSGHEDKAFVPYTSIFGLAPRSQPHSHIFIHGTITRLERNRISYIPASYEEDGGGEEKVLDFEYAIYALGAQLPSPIDVWGETNIFDLPELNGRVKTTIEQDPKVLGTKQGGIKWLRKAQRRLESVRSVLVVGGGALGIQFATDLKDLYPSKSITLLHSRDRLLPKFVEGMHNAINKIIVDLGVTVMLGQRLDLRTTLPENAEYNERGERIVRTMSGKPIASDLILLCTGQRPNTNLARKLAADVVDEETGLLQVLPSLQLSRTGQKSENQKVMEPGETDLSHIFAIGDAADAFGAIKAGHTAWFQGEVAAKNVLALIEHTQNPDSGSPVLISYTASDPSIKVTLGMKRYIVQGGPDRAVRVGEDGTEDLSAAGVWPFWGADYERDKDK
ncbi:hypothetical protein FRC09_015282 [Ceratobasidium sp. 395]|nr:hypothetical protein FRC09_015282 [Ceratobasidium sp. 395]